MRISKNAAHKLDTIALWEMLDDVRQVRGLSWRAVARDVGGVNSEVFTRMQTGKYALSSSTLVSLLLWADHLSLEGLIKEQEMQTIEREED